MRIFSPDYYKDFKCIAEKCKHSCCVGWEIDIDEDTYMKYLNIEGSLGEKMKKNISTKEGSCHFVLDGDERCPFLDENGLCEIITTYGDDYLCQICADHPRYRNFYSDRTEIGLGLCCEAAASLILNSENKTKIIEIGSDNYEETECLESDFFELRQCIFEILQCRNKPLTERLKELAEYADIDYSKLSPINFIPTFLSLEFMGTELKALFSEIDCKYNTDDITFLDTAFEQLSIYFIYRYLSVGLFDYSIKEIISFCILNILTIRELFLSKNRFSLLTIDKLIDIVRLYSCEIEYSEDNIQTLMDALIDYKI